MPKELKARKPRPSVARTPEMKASKRNANASKREEQKKARLARYKEKRKPRADRHEVSRFVFVANFYKGKGETERESIQDQLKRRVKHLNVLKESRQIRALAYQLEHNDEPTEPDATTVVDLQGDHVDHFHLQGVVHFVARKSIKQANALTGCACVPQKGTTADAVKYALKEVDPKKDNQLARHDGPEFVTDNWGEWIEEGHRSDWEQVMFQAEEGDSLKTIMRDNIHLGRCVSAVDKIRSIFPPLVQPKPMQREPIQLRWHWGRSGCGKTHDLWCNQGEGHEQCKPWFTSQPFLYTKSNGWGGYNGQECVLWDDYRKQSDVDETSFYGILDGTMDRGRACYNDTMDITNIKMIAFTSMEHPKDLTHDNHFSRRFAERNAEVVPYSFPYHATKVTWANCRGGKTEKLQPLPAPAGQGHDGGSRTKETNTNKPNVQMNLVEA